MFSWLKQANKMEQNRTSGKCIRSGPITRNGYLNFLSEFRKAHCGLTATEAIKQGAQAWRQLSSEAKRKYTQMGAGCMRPGRITKNGYFNFLREFRGKHCGLSAVEVVRQGARVWNQLTEDEKNNYKLIGIRAPRHSAKRSRSNRRATSRSRSRSNAMSSRSGSRSRRRTRNQNEVKTLAKEQSARNASNSSATAARSRRDMVCIRPLVPRRRT